MNKSQETTVFHWHQKLTSAMMILMNEEIVRITGFCWAADGHFQSLAGPRNVRVDLKYDVLCLWACLFESGRSKGLNFVLVGGTTCAYPIYSSRTEKPSYNGARVC